MKDTLNNWLRLGMSMIDDINSRNELEKDKIREEWSKSRKYPRKKKKKVRKELLLDWRIASWNPFDYFGG